MSSDALIVKAESTSGTAVTPDLPIRVRTVEPDSSETYIEGWETGTGRDLSVMQKGSHAPAGAIACFFNVNELGTLFKSWAIGGLTTSTPGGATTARNHVFIPVDTNALTTLSMQMQLERLGTTVTYNTRGTLITGWELSVSRDSLIEMSFNWIAWELVKAGGTWGDSASSVAAQAVSYGTEVTKLQFSDLAVSYGGTVSKDGSSKIYTMSGGTSVTNLDSLTISCTYDAEQRIPLGQKYAQALHLGNRETTADLTFQEGTPLVTWYDKYLNRTTQSDAWLFTFTGSQIESGQNYELSICIPKAVYEEAASPSLNAEYEARTSDVTLRGLRHATTNDAIAVRIKDTKTSY